MALQLRTPFFRTAIVAPSKGSSNPKRIKIECRKKGIHPTFYDDAKVYCDGVFVMTTSGTQKDYNVDTWSGNHPFYSGEFEYDAGDDAYFDDADYFDTPVEKEEVTEKISEEQKATVTK